MAKEALEREGHTVVEFKIGYSLAEAVMIGYTMCCASGGLNEYSNALQGETPIDEMLKLLHQA